MSFEGYVQYVCKNGHYAERDFMDISSENPFRCAFCGESASETNLVDDTNCEEVGRKEFIVTFSPDGKHLITREAGFLSEVRYRKGWDGKLVLVVEECRAAQYFK